MTATGMLIEGATQTQQGEGARLSPLAGRFDAVRLTTRL